MKGLDDYITGKYDPNAPFNQVEPEDIYYPILNAVTMLDEEYDKMLEEPEIMDELEQAYNRVINKDRTEIMKRFAVEMAKEFMNIRQARKAIKELDA